LIAIEPAHKSVIGIHISEERNMFVAENFIGSLVDKYCTHTVYTWWYIISLSLYIFAFETWVALSFGGALSKK